MSTVADETEWKPVLDPERERLLRMMEEIDARAGVPLKPSMTPEEIREAMRRDGVRPEDNIGSRGILQMRYGDDWDKD